MKLLRVFLSALLLCAAPAVSQIVPPTPAQIAEAEAALSGQDRRRVATGAARGGSAMVRMTGRPGTTIAALTARLSSPGLPPRSAVLLYSGGGAAPLTVHVFDARGLRASARTAGPRGIDAAIDQVSDELGLERASLVRSARKRSVVIPEVAPPQPDEAAAAIAELSRALFPLGVRAALADRDHVIIVPSGGIGTAPFAALDALGDGRAAIDHFSISIAPSAADVVAGVERWDPRGAFAKPLIAANPLIAPKAGWVIPPLPGAEDEARAVARQIRTNAIIGERATKATLAAAAANASLIYIATHGIADPDDPLGGGFLMLAAPSLEAGWWTAREIQEIDLSADLVVLSACQTGLGGATEGGVIGLARAFQIAGSPRVAMSLWNVDDAATRHLMTRFTRETRQAHPAEALRRAMIATRKRYPDPALWASFALFSAGG